MKFSNLKHSLLFLLFLPVNMLFGQVYQIDSLFQYIRSLDDSIRITKTLQIPYDILVANLDDCLEITEEAMEIAKNKSYQGYIAQCHYQISLLKYYKGEYDETLWHQQEALHIFDSLNDRIGMATIYAQMGYQGKRRNLDWSIKTMKKGLEIYRQENHLEGIASTVDNLGVLYEIAGKYQIATQCYLESLEIKYMRNDTVGIPYSLNHLAGIYLLQEDYRKAEKYLMQSKYIRENRGDKTGLGETHLNLGIVYRHLHQWTKSLENLNKSLKIAQEIEYPDLQRQVFYEMSVLYEEMKNYKSANEYRKLYILLNDSLINERNNQKLLELQVKFETERKEKEILQLSEEKAKRGLKIAQQRLWILLLVAGTIILIVMAIIVVLRIRQREEKKRHKAIMKEKERGIEAVINAQEEERKRISKDLHDGIGQQLSGLKLAWNKFSEKLEAKEKEDLDRLSSILDEACVDVRNISHQMMPRVLGELGLVPALEDMLNKSFLHSDIECEFEHYSIDSRFAENIEIGVYRIAQELINNVIKHSDASHVVVQLFKAKGNLILIVEDNGRGISNNEEFKGHGLLNIATRLDTIHGEVNFEPSPVSGTIATIRIPVDK